MRPPAKQQSASRAPLNHILSTEVHVRVLRVVTRSQGPLGQSEVARRAVLNSSGVRRSLADLAKFGILEFVGIGRRQLVALRDKHPLAPALRSLFASEKEVFEGFVESLRSAIANLTPAPLSAWIEGPVAEGTDREGDTTIVGLLASAANVDTLGRELDSRTIDIMSEYDVMIEVRRWTPADLATTPRSQWSQNAKTLSLHGPAPISFTRQDGPRKNNGVRRSNNHQDLDRRALAIARAIANRLRDDPSLVGAARDFIVRRMEKASPSERVELDEWLGILERLSVRQLRNFLVHRGGRATRLRQSLPFVQILSNDERQSIFESANDD